eukprot:maker-scaffold_1-snap-gene-29.40-mRNA-1 protein AED:0.26 eAED:0.37 QI:2/0/0.5/1/0/0/2/368/9
MLKGFVRLL